MDGILGLAELSAERDIDPALVLRLSAIEDRSTAVRNAVGFRLLKVQTLRELLRSPDWPVLDRVVLNAELHRQGESFDAEQLREASIDPSDEVAGLASALLFQSGDRTAWSAFRTRLASRKGEIRNPVVQELAKALLLYSIKAPVGELLDIVQDDSYTPATRMIVNGTALVLDPPAGQADWKSFVARERGQATLLRAGLQLLAQENSVAPSMGQAIRNGEPLIESIADAIEASASDDQTALASALEVVIDRSNRQAAEWAVRRAGALPSDLGARVWNHLLERFLTGPDNTLALSPVVLDAARRLALVDPSALEKLINKAKDEQQVQEILVLALCDAASPEAAAVARRVRGSFTRRGDALAILAIARGEAKLDAEILKELGIVAAGGGNLDPTLLVQAAWLFARHSGRSDEALSQLNPK